MGDALPATHYLLLMNAPVSAPSLLDAAGVDPARAQAILGDALAGADDGELFVEKSESESFLFDDGRLKSASYDSTEGFGLRVVAGETAGYAHASEVSEADIRRLMARYMWLCDTPLPEHPGDLGPQERIRLILELYSKDAVWEGVGPFYDDQFGYSKGMAQLTEHFEGFFAGKGEGQNATSDLLLNAHYLTTEQIHVHEDGTTADGQWIHMQPWLFSDGSALLRSSRLNNAYKIEDGELGAPIKGATLIGDGPTVLTKVLGVGNDFALDEGVGMCGKAGQSVPAGVGQPTLLVEGLTVGGTAA